MINKDKLKQSKTFCMLPFMHIYGTAGGDIVPCCEAQEVPLNNPGETALESWNNENYKEIRNEAYLYFYHTLGNLKYLITDIEHGDVLGVWRSLHNSFLQVTHQTVKRKKDEWSNLKMFSGARVDRFISIVSEKAVDLSKMGVVISDLDKAVTLLMGLPCTYKPVIDHFSFKSTYTFAEVTYEILKYAANNKLLGSKSTATSSKASKGSNNKMDSALSVTDEKKTKKCFKFKQFGKCRYGDKCFYKHVKSNGSNPTPPAALVQSTKSSKKEKFDPNNPTVQLTKDGHCVYCKKDHGKRKCDLIKGLERGTLTVSEKQAKKDKTNSTDEEVSLMVLAPYMSLISKRSND